MISDDDLYRLAVFLGSLAMLLIVVYHWLEVNKEKQQKQRDGSTMTESAAKKDGASTSAREGKTGTGQGTGAQQARGKTTGGAR